MRPIDADEIPYVDLNGDMPQSKIRVYVAFKERIDRLPTIATAKQGKWTVVSDGYGSGCTSACICECSLCGDRVWVYKDTEREWNYCPNCGAHMKRDGE